MRDPFKFQIEWSEDEWGGASGGFLYSPSVLKCVGSWGLDGFRVFRDVVLSEVRFILARITQVPTPKVRSTANMSFCLDTEIVFLFFIRGYL